MKSRGSKIQLQGNTREAKEFHEMLSANGYVQKTYCNIKRPMKHITLAKLNYYFKE